MIRITVLDLIYEVEASRLSLSSEIAFVGNININCISTLNAIQVRQISRYSSILSSIIELADRAIDDNMNMLPTYYSEGIPKFELGIAKLEVISYDDFYSLCLELARAKKDTSELNAILN